MFSMDFPPLKYTFQESVQPRGSERLLEDLSTICHYSNPGTHYEGYVKVWIPMKRRPWCFLNLRDNQATFDGLWWNLTLSLITWMYTRFLCLYLGNFLWKLVLENLNLHKKLPSETCIYYGTLSKFNMGLRLTGIFMYVLAFLSSLFSDHCFQNANLTKFKI